jgi:hypothetical protein
LKFYGFAALRLSPDLRRELGTPEPGLAASARPPEIREPGHMLSIQHHPNGLMGPPDSYNIIQKERSMDSFSQLILPQVDLIADAQGACDWIRKTYLDFADIFWRGMDRWGTTDAQHRYLLTLLGCSRWITHDLASNCELQTRFGGWLVDQTCQMRVAHPYRRLFHVTIINDWWITSERQTVVVLGGIKHTVRENRVPDHRPFEPTVRSTGSAARSRPRMEGRSSLFCQGGAQSNGHILSPVERSRN